jgi:hypothetical protein
MESCGSGKINRPSFFAGVYLSLSRRLRFRVKECKMSPIRKRIIIVLIAIIVLVVVVTMIVRLFGQ